MFAGVLLMVTGVMGILQGIVAIAQDDVYARIGDYVYKFNLTSWGWIHLVIGVLVAVAAWGVLNYATWARITGIAVVSINMFANFMWLPYQPVWAVVIIAIDVFVIWALCTSHSGETETA